MRDGKWAGTGARVAAPTHTPRGSKRTYLGGVPKTTGTTDDIGVYVIDTALPAGRCSVAANKLGFATRTKAPMAVSARAPSYANLYHVRPARCLAYVVSLGLAGQPSAPSISLRATSEPVEWVLGRTSAGAAMPDV